MAALSSIHPVSDHLELQFEEPPSVAATIERYNAYLATQARVSDWVNNTQDRLQSHLPPTPMTARGPDELKIRPKPSRIDTSCKAESSSAVAQAGLKKSASTKSKRSSGSSKSRKSHREREGRRRDTESRDAPPVPPLPKPRKRSLSGHDASYGVGSWGWADTENGLPSISPAVALLSSSVVVCAFLPSIVTLSAFVFLLTVWTVEKETANEAQH